MAVTVERVLASVDVGYLLLKTGDAKGAFELAGEVEASLKDMGDRGKGPFGTKIRTYLEDLRCATLNRYPDFVLYMGVLSFSTG